jgi:peptidyl-dipeptidase A
MTIQNGRRMCILALVRAARRGLRPLPLQQGVLPMTLFFHRSGLASFILLLTALAAGVAATGQAPPAGKKSPAPSPAASSSVPSVEEARAFIDAAEKQLLDLSIKDQRARWVQENFITDDTEEMAANTTRELDAASTELAARALRFRRLHLPPDLARKLLLLRLLSDIPAPRNPADQHEFARINASLDGDYGKGAYCPQGDKSKCMQLPDLEKILANSRDPQKLLDTWRGWHSVGVPMRARYVRMVELADKGAREMGFADTGALWRSKYDMPPEAFAAEVDRLWTQMRPLYLSLHAYVRSQLRKKYGAVAVPADGPIPAHLLGNMWAQHWGNIYDLVAPTEGDPGFDLTKILREKKIDQRGMVRYGERFFTSLGFDPLPETFWQRSLFIKPADRDVVCHASAWSIDFKTDLRLKMCIDITDEDFTTIHHELGHNMYQRAYNPLPFLFQNSANDGFHEATGDTIALSVTPEYLKQLGFLDVVPPSSGDFGLLLKRALDDIAFLPFGLLVDKWRWKVFSGEIKPADYNKAWWDLRERYQGVAAPAARSEADFDPGAKYHVAGNVPYMRYFLAEILHFQFHRALCREAGIAGPLHRCSIYGNKAAGAKFKKMLEMGQSRPWQEALEALTGEKQMDATAILDYFAPLKQWLDEQNAKNGVKVGW